MSIYNKRIYPLFVLLFVDIRLKNICKYFKTCKYP